jgi:hypothetical protein
MYQTNQLSLGEALQIIEGVREVLEKGGPGVPGSRWLAPVTLNGFR